MGAAAGGGGWDGVLQGRAARRGRAFPRAGEEPKGLGSLTAGEERTARQGSGAPGCACSPAAVFSAGVGALPLCAGSGLLPSPCDSAGRCCGWSAAFVTVGKGSWFSWLSVLPCIIKHFTTANSFSRRHYRLLHMELLPGYRGFLTWQHLGQGQPKSTNPALP